MRFATLAMLAALLAPICAAQATTPQTPLFPASSTNTTIPVQSAPKAHGLPNSVSGNLFFTSPTLATLQLDQTWDTSLAPDARQSMDAYFGNGDKKLSPTEVNAILNASTSDMKRAPSGFVTLDGQNVTVVDAQGTMDGAYDAASPLVLHYTLTLSFPEMTGNSHKLQIHPLSNGALTFQPPPGYSAPGGGTIPLRAGVQADIDVVKGGVTPTGPPGAVGTPTAATPVTTPQESNATPRTGSPVPPKSPVPGPGFVIVAGSLALATLVATRLKRRR